MIRNESENKVKKSEQIFDNIRSIIQLEEEVENDNCLDLLREIAVKYSNKGFTQTSINRVLNWWHSIHTCKIETKHEIKFINECVHHSYFSGRRNLLVKEKLIPTHALDPNEAAILYWILKSSVRNPNSSIIKLINALYGVKPKENEYKVFNKITRNILVQENSDQVEFPNYIWEKYKEFQDHQFDIASLLFGTVVNFANNWRETIEFEEKLQFRDKSRNPLKILLVCTIKELESNYQYKEDKESLDKWFGTRIEDYHWPLINDLLLGLDRELFITPEYAEEAPEEGIKKMLVREHDSYEEYCKQLRYDSFSNVFMRHFITT